MEEGVAGDGVGLVEVGNVGELDEDGVAPLDVTGLLAGTRLREREEDGVARGK
jgi:hypothetical protein